MTVLTRRVSRERLIGWLATLTLPASLLLAVPVAGQGGGEVQGMVTLRAAEKSAPAMLSPYARRRYTPPPAATPTSASPQSVVVYVNIAGRSGTPGTDAVIRQRNRTISPSVTVIQKGTRIQFPNDDNVYHNLFSLSSTRPFNLGRYAPGASRSILFDKSGIVRMFCDIHSEMSGTVLVLDTPFVARPDETGRFVIRNVPPGRHTLVAWHEATGAVSTTIAVSAGGTARVDLELAN